ncbi:hypothetical protein NXC12_CH02556 [Rhizobium etli]|uniref:Uncharacterized protein n=1 Tax=Rhizobium etli TaxID=29449 RepID=A0AAN1BGG0_RHIET|nr:hypothetical protein NXC12_CH02556 [Rhizobium etli]
MRGAGSSPLGYVRVLRAFLSSLIAVLVTGIQPRRVCAVINYAQSSNEPSLPKDLGTLDSCDKHRHEGSEWGGAAFHGKVLATAAHKAKPRTSCSGTPPLRNIRA